MLFRSSSYDLAGVIDFIEGSQHERDSAELSGAAQFENNTAQQSVIDDQLLNWGEAFRMQISTRPDANQNDRSADSDSQSQRAKTSKPQSRKYPNIFGAKNNYELASNVVR